MGRSIGKAEIGILILIIACAASVVPVLGSELALSGTLSPGNVVSPGQNMTAEYKIGYSLDSDDESLQLYTDLSGQKWQISIVIDGVYHVLPSTSGRYVTLSGFELYYAKSSSSYLSLTLTGTVPEVSASGNYTVFRVTQYGSDGSAEYEETVSALFINSSDVDDLIDTREAELEELREYLDEMSVSGSANTTAEEKYSEAAEAIEEAKSSDTSSAVSLLETAETCIDESYLLAETAEASLAIDRASSDIEVVEGMIEAYDDEDVSEDSAVWTVQSHIDNAKTLLALAEDKFSLSDFSSASDYAEQAEAQAETAYEYACTLTGEDVQSSTLSKTSTASATSTETSGDNSTDLLNGTDILSGVDLGEFDDFFHSEVSLDSLMDVGGVLVDAMIDFIGFLEDLIDQGFELQT